MVKISPAIKGRFVECDIACEGRLCERGKSGESSATELDLAVESTVARLQEQFLPTNEPAQITPYHRAPKFHCRHRARVDAPTRGVPDQQFLQHVGADGAFVSPLDHVAGLDLLAI